MIITEIYIAAILTFYICFDIYKYFKDDEIDSYSDDAAYTRGGCKADIDENIRATMYS